MPKPTVGRGSILVRTRYSLISVGTEIASLAPDASSGPDSGPVEKAQAYGNLASQYLGKAVRDPKKAMQRLRALTISRLHALMPVKPVTASKPVNVGGMIWRKVGGGSQQTDGNTLRITTDTTEFGYQSMTDEISIPKDHAVVLEVRGEIEKGAVCIGLIAGTQGPWLGFTTFEAGVFDEKLVFDVEGAKSATVVIANAGHNDPSSLKIEPINVSMVPPAPDGASQNEMDQQGWNVGYSLAGEVVKVGPGVDDLVPGDLVACAGAGQANHADYVSVKRNLVCRVPKNCDLRWAATTTVGVIALQGVRRAAPELGERIAVIGLGLIGQLTVQMLRAAGCRVYGLDLDPERVERAKAVGLDGGASNVEDFKHLIRDVTSGHGTDRTLITAATTSSDVTNLSMEITRRKGTVVLVGDVGLNIERPDFYRKEIDLLMSTSYGPGRYDAAYEIDGNDYPFAYVRWTENRNMESYLDLVSSGRLNIEPLIDSIIPVDEAPATYKALAGGKDTKPLGVLISYPETEMPETDEAVITLRGHRKPQSGPINFALVGAGAFGTSMLVPQMQKQKNQFFLKAVVSSDATRGGNFARSQGIEILASDMETVLGNPEIDLIVIATRHNLHAEQVVRALGAGKHVFTEKPLALSWNELHSVTEAYNNRETDSLLMVGFNRRFAPAIIKLKETITQRRSPLIINYRLNGGFIPAENWIQGPEGGGRNLGEACHMYDVFRSLASAPVASIQAAAIDPVDTAYQRNDNFCATITYEDGSIGNLVYTALGPKKGLPKEHLEVFTDGEAFVIDDFTSLSRAGDETPLWQAAEADKGHFEELKRLGEAIAGGKEAPIPFDEIIETSSVALHIEDQLFGRA
ncbi:MAG: Gfo/Idh/MocA family oxidoreductase [Rhodospirillales bacterium]|nr:Gfo/Idh/MocA family oxidoreductase [Rhodospirillales bacterium]